MSNNFVIKSYSELIAFTREVGLDAIVYFGNFIKNDFVMDDRMSLLAIRGDGVVQSLERLPVGLDQSFDYFEHVYRTVRYYIINLPKDCARYVLYVPVHNQHLYFVADELLNAVLTRLHSEDIAVPTIWDFAVLFRDEEWIERFDHARVDFKIAQRTNFIDSEEEYND